MRSIDSLILEALDTVKVDKQIERDDRVAMIYQEYPDLRHIDADIIESRNDRLMSIIDGDEGREKLFDSKEKALVLKRQQFLAEHNISPDFDELKDRCTNCHDTGYYTNSKGIKMVCSCRNSELELCYELSGMKDYSTYSIRTFDAKHCNNSSRRSVLIKKFSKIIKDGVSDNTLMVYSDGVSTGKTFLAVVIAKLAISCGRSAVYDRSENLGRLSEEEVEYYKNCDLLILDDYSGEVTRKAATASNLNQIIESRIATSKPVVLVASSPIEILVSDSDARIASKLSRAEVL